MKLPGWTALILILLLATLSYRQYTAVHNPQLFAAKDERVFHAPEIARLAQGGALVSSHTGVAMIPGYHALMAAVPAPQRLNVHTGLAILAVLALWLLASQLLAPPAAQVAFALALLSPYLLGTAAWLGTDALGLGLFALSLFALQRSTQQQTWPNGLLLALAAVSCVLVRSIYLVALVAVLLPAMVLPQWKLARRDALLALAAIAAACLPFFIHWRGLTSPGVNAYHDLGLYRSVIAAQLCWLGVLAPGLMVATGLPPLRALLGYLLLGISATALLLAPGTHILLLSESNALIQTGAVLYLPHKMHLAAALILPAQISGIALGASLLGYALHNGWRQRAYLHPALWGMAFYLLSLWLQPRPYQRYFEVLAAFTVLALLRSKLALTWPRYLPLLFTVAAYAAAFHLFTR